MGVGRRGLAVFADDAPNLFALPFVDGDEADFQPATEFKAWHRHIVIAHDADVVSVFGGPHAPLGHEQHALQLFDLFGQGFNMQIALRKVCINER